VGTAQGALNQATWTKRSALEDLDRVGPYTDAGERAALEHIREVVRGSPILELGVGTGRTVPLMRPLTHDYRALDISPAMVETTRSRYPGLRLELGDARTLEGYPPGHFGLVTFSYSGIDAMPPADRRSVLKAVHRVLAPGGIFFFSVLNLDGPSFDERPWRLRVWPTKNPIRYAARVAAQVTSFPINLRNWLRICDGGERGPGYAVAPLSAHHYSILAHYTTLERQLSELAELGFDRGGPVFDSRRGVRVSPADDSSRVDWFQIVARRQ
jgi:SAM-dependent methyltransferase